MTLVIQGQFDLKCEEMVHIRFEPGLYLGSKDADFV